MSKCNADVLAIDTAHGHTERVMEAIKAIRQRLPEMQLIAETWPPTKPPRNSSPWH